jgi:uncharacterized protein (TIGR03067 family)
MKKIVALVILASAVLAGLTGCPGVACFGIDTCKLQGTWEASTTTDGVTKITNRMVITDDNVVYTTFDGTPVTLEGKYTIDATTSPKNIDSVVSKVIYGEGDSQQVSVVDPPKKYLGIYQVSNTEMIFQATDTETRPTAFDDAQAVKLTRVQ